MKTGRKRKPGRRYASGDRVKAVRQDETRRVALEARMRVFGVGPELAGRDVMGSPLGRLLHWKIITPAQAEAGYDFALTLRDYLAASEGQRPSQGKASFLPSMRGTTGAVTSVSMSGRSGTANGRRVMITFFKASPGTSTPCQKLSVPNSTLRGFFLNRSSI